MTPLIVRAHIANAIAGNSPIALDALLMAAVALRDGLTPPRFAEDCGDIEIPVQKSECGRVYLASFAVSNVEAREGRWINRKFPVAEAQALAEPNFRRIQINAGAQKSYRLPLETRHLENDLLTWWCIGERDAILELLTTCIGYVGKKRGVGLGRVRRWEVEACEPWEGFPVLRDGLPLRTLPTDWAGLRGHVKLAYRVLAPPYWAHAREELAAVPEGA